MLEASGLRKSFGPLTAVEDVSFTVRRGEVLGLLGPNGAGKTTTLSLITGLLRPDAGEVRIEGAPIRGDSDPRKGRIGLVTQEIALYDNLSGVRNLKFFGALFGLGGARLDTAVDRALDLVGLADRASEHVKNYSGGMKRRLNLAAGLIHDPDVLLMDEPTVGVDPQSRNAIFDNIEALKARGKAIVYTTHYMEEAERLCDSVVIIDHGKVIAEGSTRDLGRRLPSADQLLIQLETAPDPAWLDELQVLPQVVSATMADGLLTVKLDGLAEGAPIVLAWLAQKRIAYTRVQSQRAGLEEVFLALTGRRLRNL